MQRTVFAAFLGAVIIIMGVTACSEESDQQVIITPPSPSDTTDTTEWTPPVVPEQYAVLVHGSKGFANYRHLADVLSVYQLLRKNGFDDDHIILIIDKTLANNTQNDEPGIIRISTDDKDLLSGSDGLPQAVVDYDAADLTPADISDILLEVGSPTRHILLYWSGHGVKGNFRWRDTNEAFTADLMRQTVEQMQYQKLFVITETCYGGSVIAQLEGLTGVLAMSAANANEESWADNWNDSMLVWMCDTFTKNLVSFLSTHPSGTYQELYQYTSIQTPNSHVTMVNAPNFGDISVDSPGEFFTKQQ